MRSHRALLLWSTLVATASWTACDAQSDAEGGRLVIAVAPLELPGLVDATYTLAVTSPDGVVWTKTVTSSQYGDGSGAVSYVGTCDADANPNTITLVLDELRTNGGALTPGLDFANPAPVGAPIELRADCLANADVAVAFELTVARAATQGFFDVAVSFDDLFCSAKLDCLNSADAPLELLFHPHTGERDVTAVLGFACTGGLGSSTQLCLDPVSITCDDGSVFEVDASGGPGNLNPAFPGPPNTSDLLFQAAVYRGTEQLQSGGTSWGKTYWNLALGLNTAAFGDLGVCRLTTGATANSTGWGDGTTPYGMRWPTVTWAVDLTDDSGGLACTRHELDAPASGVATVYTDERTFAACYDSQCDNGVLDGDETAVDCGGSCTGCPASAPCVDASDCQSQLCTGGFCVEPTCDDGEKNGGETGVDCGGGCPDECLSADTLYEVITAAPTLLPGDHTFIVHGEPIDVEYLTFGATTVATNTSLGDGTPDDRLVVARYDGDLTVASGATLTTSTRKKGMVLWVRGQLTLDGTLSMTDRGARAPGQDVWLVRNPDDSVVILPAGGATGAARANGSYTNVNGLDGVDGTTAAASGGGGSGAAHCNTCTAYSGAGAAGTSWSGGAGGGGVSRYYSNGNASNGATSGGAGGTASAYHPSNGYGKAAGGGAGNPGGAGRASQLGTGYAGDAGTGGLIIVFAEDGIDWSGLMTSDGSPGGAVTSGPTQWNAGGGGSGGGPIYVFYGGALNFTGGTAHADGGSGGLGSCHLASCLNGGDGGDGYVSIEPFTPCADCGRCDTGADCESGVCNVGYCVAARCDDGIMNGEETCVDAGGDCPNPCPAGATIYEALSGSPTLPDGDWRMNVAGTELPIEAVSMAGTTLSSNTSLGNGAADSRSLVVRVDGDLTVGSGATLTAATRKRGMFLWVRGNLTVNGAISMTARGAIAAGQTLPLADLGDGSTLTVPAAGAGGAGRANGSYTGVNGVSGAAGSGLRSGGGGSGAAHCNSCTGYSGAGAAGTSWSGGSGGGGVSRISNGNAGNAAGNGGAGGYGSAYQSCCTYYKGAGGGAGNNGGAAATSQGYNGGNGTGGLLVVYVEGDVVNDGSLVSGGSNGGGTGTHSRAWNAGGGASGGGIVVLLHRGVASGAGSLSAPGGTGGQGHCHSSNCLKGGNGGNGSAAQDVLP